MQSFLKISAFRAFVLRPHFGGCEEVYPELDSFGQDNATVYVVRRREM